MAKKDLKGVIDGIESSQDVVSRLEEKDQRLTELVEKQKKVIKDQNDLLEKQKEKLAASGEIPDDVRELGKIIGEQRALIKEKEMEFEQTKGAMIQAQTELQMLLKRIDPQQLKIEGAIKTIGDLKEDLAQKKSELSLKNETIKTLSNRLKEAENTSKSLQEKLENMESGVSKEEIESLKVQRSEERKQLKTEITKLESKLLDQKLEYEERLAEAKDIKERYNDLFKKVNELTVKNEEAKETIKNLESKTEDLKTFKSSNIDFITHLSKLQPLMEEFPILKAYFIVREVGSISLEDLKAAVGSPIVTVTKDVQKLKAIGILEENAAGKIIPKKESL
ncbi:MAG TPA: hypothetical protein VGB37_11005 [Candidatus Lokiarchaeia archaeon]